MAAAWPAGRASPAAGPPVLVRTLWLVTVAAGHWGAAVSGAVGSEETPKCEDLRVGQYICKEPKINDATQEPVNCTNYTAHVQCFPAPNIICKDYSGNETHFTGSEVGFLKPIPCRNVNGYSYKVAVALSLFLGWLGADRFYLGYPALGLLKFCTVGFCGIGSLIDFVLISMQVVVVNYTAISFWESGLDSHTRFYFLGCGNYPATVISHKQIVGPSDGSSYIIDYYGTRLTRLSITNETFRKTQAYP